MAEGIIKWFDEKKGFGFLECEGKDYFVHYKEIKGDGFRTLDSGTKVSFTAESSPKGGVAKAISKI